MSDCYELDIKSSSKRLQEAPSIFQTGLIDLIRPISKPAAVLIGKPFQSSAGGMAMSTSTRFFSVRAVAISPFTRLLVRCRS